MNRRIFLALSGLALCAALAVAVPASAGSSSVPGIAGVWSTVMTGPKANHYNLTLVQKGFAITGTYGSAGTVKGSLSGHVLSGTWTDKSGTGWFKLTFSTAATSFKGSYGTVAGTPAGDWTGKFKQPAS